MRQRMGSQWKLVKDDMGCFSLRRIWWADWCFSFFMFWKNGEGHDNSCGQSHFWSFNYKLSRLTVLSSTGQMAHLECCVRGSEDVVVVWLCLVCFLDRLCHFAVISIACLLASSAFLLNLPIPCGDGTYHQGQLKESPEGRVSEGRNLNKEKEMRMECEKNARTEIPETRWDEGDEGEQIACSVRVKEGENEKSKTVSKGIEESQDEAWGNSPLPTSHTVINVAIHKLQWFDWATEINESIGPIPNLSDFHPMKPLSSERALNLHPACLATASQPHSPFVWCPNALSPCQGITGHLAHAPHLTYQIPHANYCSTLGTCQACPHCNHT